MALIQNLMVQTDEEIMAKDSQERQAETAFDKQEGEAKALIAKEEATVTLTKNAIADHKQEKESCHAELTDASALLDEANQYYESLQEKCVHAQSAEERAKARAEEIASLEQALAILEGQ